MIETTASGPAPASRGSKGARRLKVHGVWVRPAEAAHAEMAALLKAVAGSRAGFVDVPALGTVGSMAQVIVSDEEGRQFVLDTSGPTPVMRPWSGLDPGIMPGGEARQVLGSGEVGATGGGASGSDGAARSGGGPAAPSFAEDMLTKAGEKLAKEFLTSLFAGESIGPALAKVMDRGSIISGLGGAALDNLGNMLLGSLMGSLFGGVTDASSLGSQVAAKFGPQLMGLAQSNFGKVVDAAKGGGFSPEVMEEIEAYFFGVASAASVPLGKATDSGGAGYVLVEGGTHGLKVGDEAVHHDCSKTAGPYVEGHPTIFINGEQAIGKGHKAICGCGEAVMPKNLAGSVLMGKPPAPPSPAPGAGGGAGGGGGGGGGPGAGSGTSGGTAGTIGDSCDPKSDAVREALAENEEGPDRIGRPLVCEADSAHPTTGTIQRPESWNPREWAKTLFGIKDVATPEQAAQGIENWELLWGAIEIGGPQEPRAGAAGTWWIPDKVFGYSMSSYYLYHDREFDDNRNLSQLGTILGVEGESFYEGLKGGFDPARLVLQLIYSGFTTGVGVGTASVNTAKGRPPAKPRNRA